MSNAKLIMLHCEAVFMMTNHIYKTLFSKPGHSSATGKALLEATETRYHFGRCSCACRDTAGFASRDEKRVCTPIYFQCNFTLLNMNHLNYRSK